MEDVTFIPGIDVGISSDAPSGVSPVQAGDGVSGPLAAITGAPSQTSQTVISGTERTTPKGPPVFRWNKYDLLYNAYFGLGGFYDGTALYKSQVEVDDQYLERRATTSYRNFLRQIIDATYLPVFATGATRKTEVNGILDEKGDFAPLWNAFLDNTDNRHTGIQKFTKKIVRHARILGVSFMIVDNFKEKQVPLLSQTALANRAFPYCYMRLPQQVEPKNTKIDEFNCIEKICFREAPEQEIDPKTKQRVLAPRWKLWTKTYSVKLRKTDEGELIEIPGTKFEHGLEEVPVIAIMSSEVEEGTILPHPDFYSIARTNLDIYNIDSAQMRAIRANMFPILCLPMTKDNDPSNKQAVNVLQGFYLPADTPDATYKSPMYLAPSTAPFDAVAQMTKDLINYLYKQAGQQGVVGVEKASSGVAKAYDFQAQEFVLMETAKMAKVCEEEIARIFQKYVISEKFTYTVFYEDNFSPTGTAETLKLYADYMDLQPGTSGRALALEQVTRMVFDDLDDEIVQPIIDEIRENLIEEKKNKQDISPADENANTDVETESGNPASDNSPPGIDFTKQKRITKVGRKRKGFTI